MHECQTCLGLWERHTTATREHVLLENKLRMATLRGKYDVLHRLNVDLDAAYRELVRLREAIRLHDATVHVRVVKAKAS